MRSYSRMNVVGKDIEKSVTRKDLAYELESKLQIGAELSKETIRCVFDSMSKFLLKGRRIEIRGFGSFYLKLRKGREGLISPSTGESLERTEDRTIVVFKSGKSLRDGVRRIHS